MPSACKHNNVTKKRQRNKKIREDILRNNYCRLYKKDYNASKQAMQANTSNTMNTYIYKYRHRIRYTYSVGETDSHQNQRSKRCMPRMVAASSNPAITVLMIALEFTTTSYHAQITPVSCETTKIIPIMFLQW